MSEVSESNAVMSPTLHHINLKTRRLQEMIDWYTTVVGMKAVFQFPGGAWLTNDAANHRLALLTSPQLSEDPDKLMHTGIHHSAFEYATIGDLLDTYVRLKSLGIEPHACLDHGMTTSFYYVDPDGNSVELQVDNFGNWEESSEWMSTSPQFAADPIGMPVDPAQMVVAHKAGTSFAELHRRAYAGEFKPAGPLDMRVPLGDPRAPM
jgi:catechol 2,3-dioxygenase